MKALNRVIILLTVFAVFSFVNRAQAADDVTTTTGQTPTWEWTGNTAASYTHTTTSGNGSHSWNLGFGGNYFFNNMYELGATVAFSDQSGILAGFSIPGVEIRTLSLLVGPTFNFMGSPENACFLTTQVGVLLTGNGNLAPNATQFDYFIGVGRRVEIVKHVTWKPEIAFTGTAKNTDSATGIVTSSRTDLEVIPFQFSLLF